MNKRADDEGRYRLQRGAARAAIKLKSDHFGDPYGKPLPTARAMAGGYSTKALGKIVRGVKPRSVIMTTVSNPNAMNWDKVFSKNMSGRNGAS